MDDELNDLDYPDHLDGLDLDYVPYTCQHGREDNCDDCDAILDECGGDIDKCLNCGRYKAGNQLTEDQVCKIGCTNPNEY